LHQKEHDKIPGYPTAGKNQMKPNGNFLSSPSSQYSFDEKVEDLQKVFEADKGYNSLCFHEFPGYICMNRYAVGLQVS
jgi:hypothetical protein